MDLKPMKKSKGSEKVIEAYLKKQVKTIKIQVNIDGEKEWLCGIAHKFVSPLRRSVPDDICLFPKGLIVFVECKSFGKKLTEAQMREGNRLRKLGFLVVMVDSKESVDSFIGSIKKLYLRGGKLHEGFKI